MLISSFAGLGMVRRLIVERLCSIQRLGIWSMVAALSTGVHPFTGALTAQSGGVYRLAEVKVIGSTRFRESEIVRASGLNLAENVTLDSLRKAADTLGTLGVFAEVSYRYRTRGNNLSAEFNVKDADRFLPCSFDNLVWYSDEELLRELTSRVPLFDGQAPASGTMLEHLATALAAMLELRGIRAQVRATPTGALGGPVQAMQFKVEGVAIPVRRIEFKGVEKVDPALLQEAARPLIDKDFDASFIKSFSYGGIGRVYQQRGYLKAKFGDPVPELLKGVDPPNSVLVTIPVNEGEQYRLKAIEWTGESVIPYGDLAKSIQSPVGEPVDALRLEQDVLALPMLFHPKGYLLAEVRPTATVDDAGLTATYEMRVIQGDLYRLGKLEIAGLDEARVRMLLGACRMHTGDPYDRTYWNKFFQETSRHLPPNASGWRVRSQENIQHETNTVDVTLIYTPGGSR